LLADRLQIRKPANQQEHTPGFAGHPSISCGDWVLPGTHLNDRLSFRGGFSTARCSQAILARSEMQLNSIIICRTFEKD